jgi:outer membrane protein, heavy metal efflux system
MRYRPNLAAAGLTGLLLSSCAIHPHGEEEERQRAREAGAAFEKKLQDRDLPPLPGDASREEILRHAFLANAELEGRYWEWISALEQIPQDGSPRTTAALFFNHLFEGGSSTVLERSMVTIGNDPMFNLPWPGKLSTAARRALENARAAGLRFESAGFELQRRVLTAYLDWALLAEEMRLREANVALLTTIQEAATGRTRAGGGSQQDILKTRTRRELASNDLESLRSRVPGQRARINALLGRPPGAPLAPPGELPAPGAFSLTDEEILARITSRNPELAAITREMAGREEGIRLAKLEAIPELGLSAGADLGGMGQTLAGMVTFPLLRYEAIEAGIAQARANLAAAEAMRRQAENDLGSRAIASLQSFRNAERQVELFQGVIIPAAEGIISSTRASYSAGQIPLIELLDSQSTLLEVRSTLARLRMEREAMLAELEAMAAIPFPLDG